MSAGVVLARPSGGFPLERLAQGLGSELESSLDVSALELLDAWLTDLCAWNAKVDLTAARTVDELTDLMVADAIVAARSIPEGARVVDVGTGAGAPGLALGILRRDLKIHLAEPLQKRASFLRTMIGKLRLDHVTLSAERGEALAPNAWDVSMARATLPPDAWARLGLVLAPKTIVFLAKETVTPPEGSTIVTSTSYTWPLTHSARTLIVLSRIGARE